MQKMPGRRVFGLRGMVVVVAIAALTVSLASRTFPGNFHPKVSVHGATSGAKIQHRDKNASEWVPPTPLFTQLPVSEPSLARPPQEKVLVVLHFESLYNRPPPIG
jgi:hypothetical protein